MAEQFPFVSRAPEFAAASFAPMLPLTLVTSRRVAVSGLLDTGAAVSVLPYAVGVDLGFNWNQQPVPVQLSGNLAIVEARAILVSAFVGSFAPVRLAFAWAPPMPDADKTNSLVSVREGYDRWALVYDHDANPLPALEGPHVRESAGDVRGLSVLDLGCGTGRHAAWMAAAGAHVTAVDFSEGMLAEARRKPESATIRFVVHDLHEPLPFSTGAFDLVVCGLVLEHLRDLPGFFGEAHRVLRPSGRAVMSAMHPAMFLRGSQARFTDPGSEKVVQPGSLPHSLGNFVMAAARAGFGLEDIGEYAPEASFAAQYPRAEKYVGWPMLVILQLRADKR